MQPELISKPIWIDSPNALLQLIAESEQEPRLAIDTESNSLYVYKEEVCLIQISTPTNDYLIDPFKVRDLSPLRGLFASAKQEKIFHAAEYDIICLKRDFHFEFNRIFDTMIAARILAEPQIGLGSLLNSKFNLEIDKHYQRADWGVRPLPEPMLDYARLDTHYLFQLRDQLADDLLAKDLMALAEEDFHLVCKVKAHPVEHNNKGCWKVAGSNHIDSRQAAILQELCKYREDRARSANLPPFKVLSNQLLFEVSKAIPHTLEELKLVPGISEKNINRHGEGLLQAVQKGESVPPLIRQHQPRPDEQFLQRFEALKDLRKLKAKEMKVESDVFLPKETMEKIALRAPSTLKDLEVVMSETPVRFIKFGEQILEAITKKEIL
jgi:ribonuclease D